MADEKKKTERQAQDAGGAPQADQQADGQNGEASAALQAGATRQIRLIWDDAQMRTAFANVVNVTSTREEVMLFFGTNQTWNPQDKGELRVRLDERVILSPHAAKRLAILLDGVVKQYEQRFGALEVAGRG